ncbi:MAG: YraN family protein [Desulfobacterales bacterium]
MVTFRQAFGQSAERRAARFLRRSGYRILETNYRNRIGEIDIIAKDGDALVFVEVKARRSNRYGGPKAAVTHRKQRKISMTALAYLKETRQSDVKARFDVVAVYGQDNASAIELVRNAFEIAYD